LTAHRISVGVLPMPQDGEANPWWRLTTCRH